MTKDLEYYKKQEKVFERRINLLKKEVDKLTLDKNELKQQLSMHVISQQRELLAKYTKWQNEVKYSCDELMYADIDKFLNG